MSSKSKTKTSIKIGTETLELLNVDDSFKLIDLYFKQHNILYTHQTRSFDQFIEEYIPNFLKNNDHVFFEQVTKDKVYRYKFLFDNIRIKPPVLDNEDELMFPTDARLFSLTYASKILAKVTQIQEIISINANEDDIISTKVIGNIENDVPIAKIPIMVRSKYCNLTINKDHEKAKQECEYDPGAYFIVHGSEKVVMSLEKMIENKPLVFIKKEQNAQIHMVQINSKNYTTNSNVQIFTMKMKKDNLITLNISQFNEVSIFIFLRALGLESDQDIIDYIVTDDTDVDMINQIRLCIESSKRELNKPNMIQEDAINYLMNKMKTSKKYSDTNPEIRNKQKRMHLMKILTQDILPHMGTNIRVKSYFICHMINKLLKCFLGRIKPDDRDSFVNKRVDLPGPLFALLFQLFFKKLLNDCYKQFHNRNTDDKNPINIINQIKPNIIEQGIKSSLSTGAWGGSKTRKGVAQMLARLTYIQTISTFRKIVSPNIDASTNKLTNPRHLHNSQFGMICPVETPEGPKTGLVKNLTMTANVTLMMESQIHIIKDKIIKYLYNLEEVSAYDFKKYFKVFLNGEWLGMSSDPIKLLKMLRDYRFNGVIEKTVSIVPRLDDREIRIYCDGGRIYRPLLTVNNYKLLLTKNMIPEIENMSKWNELLLKHPKIIEYIDVEEAETLMIAMYPSDIDTQYQVKMGKFNTYTLEKVDKSKINRYDNTVYLNYTHCEIHPSLMLGVVASSIPFCNHNQSPRNIYQYSQAKQAMGIYISNYRNRLDISYILYHSQLPVVATRGVKYTHIDKLTAGENVIVAIASYTGYNQEDSIVMNQSAVDRGLFRSTGLKKYNDQIQPNQSTSQHDVFMKPTRDKVSGMKDGNYEKLNAHGFVPEETQIENNDVIIGKSSPISISSTSGKIYKDSSTIYKSGVAGTIDKVYSGLHNHEGYEMIKMRIRMERVPKIGDKFSSRHGQKGTCGILLRAEDMPMTENGVIPDIIINPNCIPKRMTIGQLIEMLLGKVAATEFRECDATPFNFTDIELIKDRLEKLGFERNGNEVLYNGMTGEPLETMIFIGPAYYQRLKHMVDDKMHSRAHGPKQILTRQPPEGRSRDGGLRFGEMERDCMLSHGLAQFLKERLMDTSDLYSCYVCDKCGFIATKMKNKEVHMCQACNNTTEISKIVVPYAFKLMIQELMCMNIAPRIRVNKDINSTTMIPTSV
jgi:DNA-directed RNA polymerase II subunit RPB2